MLTSVQWLNQYLKGGPGPVSPDEADHVLTHVGFPIEAREDVPGGDVQLDVELTSNRGDCLSHLGLAREIAAATGRTLVPPQIKDASRLTEGSGEANSISSVENHCDVSGGCPRFTARVIRGVKVGPSPEWMVRALEAVGQRSINNVVDVSNYVLHELGHPCHTFDLNTLEEKRLIVRMATKDEKLVTLDGHERTLTPEIMVVADAKRAVSLGGMIGGLDTSVTDATTDVLLEMATWDPVMIRRAARSIDIRTDASHRFERYVDGRDIDFAALRAAELIVEIAGGEIVAGLIDEGRDPQPLRTVEMRTARCEHLLGIHVPVDEMVRVLEAIGIQVDVKGAGAAAILRCSIPAHRHDLTREIDLVEEVVRLHGFDHIGIAPSMDVHLELAHPESWAEREKAMDEIGRVLTGMGFYETVTFSFASAEEAALFEPQGLRLLKVDEERRKGTPFLRPSIIPSLLTCRRANQDGRVSVEGGVRLFECASVYAEIDDADTFARRTLESRNLALLADAPKSAGGVQQGLRLVRGAIEGVVRAVGGAGPVLELEATETRFMPALDGQTVASVMLDGRRVGYVATFAGGAIERFWDLDEPVVAAEVNLDTLIDLYPPKATVHELPKFPSIERDLSLIVEEPVTLEQVSRTIDGANLDLLVGCSFAGIFRGKQIGAGKKSLTLSLEFRDPERTLRHEEVDPQVDAVVRRLKGAVGAEIRTAGASA